MMHPELEHAFTAGLSMEEVIEIFSRHHHGGSKGEPTEYKHSVAVFLRQHNKSEFWDEWGPLFRYQNLSGLYNWYAAREPFLGVHRTLTKEVISWFCDSKSKHSVYFIAESWRGRLGVYQCSRAAAFIKICSDAQRLAAVLYPSFGSGSHDIYQLSVRLAERYPPFRRILARILIDTPGILKLPMRTCLKKLILEPWKLFQKSHPHCVAAPLVFFIRCDVGKGHEELIRTICEFSLSLRTSGLLWIISINRQFRLPLPVTLEAPFRYIRPPICYNEGPGDTALVLRHEFQTLRRKHKNTFDGDEAWPSEEQMSRLVKIVSGVFEFVDVIIQFVDWVKEGGPRVHLETFLAYMVDSPSPSDERPYRALDHFYVRALSDIHPDVLSAVNKTFGLFLFDRHFYSLRKHPFDLVYLLSLESDISTQSHLERLAVTKAYTGGSVKNPYVRNPYFERFLEDPSRSGKFHFPRYESSLHGCQACLHILSHPSNFITMLKPQGTRPLKSIQQYYINEIVDLKRFAFFSLCHILDVEIWRPLLSQFYFRCLADMCDNISLRDFQLLLRRLYTFDKANSRNIVRIEPASPLDNQLIDKCEGVVEPMDLVEWGAEEYRPSSDPKYVLLGYGDGTVLVVMPSPVNGVDGVCIYTSAMLEYM